MLGINNECDKKTKAKFIFVSVHEEMERCHMLKCAILQHPKVKSQRWHELNKPSHHVFLNGFTVGCT